PSRGLHPRQPGSRAERCGLAQAPQGAGRVGARRPHRTRATRPPAALRSRGRPNPYARRGRPGVQRDSRAHPSDRSEGAPQAAPPLAEPQAQGLSGVTDERGRRKAPLFISGLRAAPALVTDELGQRLAPARRSLRSRVIRGSRAPDHHDLARMPILWDAEDPFRLRLERRLTEPGDATAVAEQLRSGEQALGHATLVIGLAESAPGREHDRDAERRAGRPVDARAQRRDRSEALLVPDHDEVPWLAIPRAARPAGELEEFVNDIVGDRFVLVLPDLRYATDRPEGLHEREHSQAGRA